MTLNATNEPIIYHDTDKIKGICNIFIINFTTFSPISLYMFLMGIKMWWVRRFIAPIWKVVGMERKGSVRRKRRTLRKQRSAPHYNVILTDVSGGASPSPTDKRISGFVGERLAAPAAGRWSQYNSCKGNVRFVGYGACRRTAWLKRVFSISRFR